jgi:hypothetical protein
MRWDQLSVVDLTVETGIEASPEEISHTLVVQDSIKATSAITSTDVPFTLDVRLYRGLDSFIRTLQFDLAKRHCYLAQGLNRRHIGLVE